MSMIKLSRPIAIFIIIWLSGCSSLHFNSSELGLLESGHIWSQDNCSKHINPNDYQACMNQVDKHYSNAKYDLKLKQSHDK